MPVINNKELNQYELLPPSRPSPRGKGHHMKLFPPGGNGKGGYSKRRKGTVTIYGSVYNKTAATGLSGHKISEHNYIAPLS